MHLGNLLSDLALLTANEADFQRKVSSQEVDLPTVLNKAIKRHKGFAAKKHITIVTDKLPEATVRGDESYLERLFSNIITNAISYGNDHGHVRVSGNKDSKNVQIYIKDDGIGIPEKDLPHIFERFYRVDGSRSKDHGGTGLGLAIVQRIVEAHGGSVGAQSSADKGSTFTVTLPLNKG
jgi:signal transduction histidine kinase